MSKTFLQQSRTALRKMEMSVCKCLALRKMIYLLLGAEASFLLFYAHHYPNVPLGEGGGKVREQPVSLAMRNKVFVQ